MSTNTLGRYEIVREIARSNDVVYEATDPSINRRLAVKELVIPPNLTGQQKRERVERFYREARAAGSLSHPNIVTIYEAGEDHGRHFIAMEFLEGQTLRDVLDIEGKISVDRAVEIALQICDALSYAHSKRVIHRDIKPDNVHILPSGRIKITDFGIARLMEEPSLTADGQVFGTPSYMSPEQVAGRTLDARTDLFSLAIVLYEMLTGRKPFTGDSVVTITYNIMNQDVTIPPDVPPYLERVIRRSLSKNPDLRYQSAAEMAGDLDPASFQDTGAVPQPGAFDATTSMAGSLHGPTAQPSPAPGSGDVFGGLRPDDISLPKLPVKPILSAEAKYFIKVLVAVMLICAVVIGFVWALSAAYRGYQRVGREEEIGSHLLAGKKYFDSQSYGAAIEEFNEVLALATDPEVVKVAKKNMAISYLQLGMQSESAGNTNEAVARYRQALIYDPDSADANVLLGNSLAGAGRDGEALAAWERAVKSKPGSQASSAARQSAAVLYHKRGDQAYERGDADAAVRWWRKATEIAPGTEAGFLAQEKIERVLGIGR